MVGPPRVCCWYDRHYRRLLHCLGLLLVQAHPNVGRRCKPPGGLQASPQVADCLCHSHNPLAHHHHCYSMLVHPQLQQGPEASCQRQDCAERQDIQYRNAVTERTCAITTDGNRLVDLFHTHLHKIYDMTSWIPAFCEHSLIIPG